MVLDWLCFIQIVKDRSYSLSTDDEEWYAPTKHYTTVIHRKYNTTTNILFYFDVFSSQIRSE